jgi:integrase
MARIASEYSVQRRSKKNKSFILTLNPGFGLPDEVCDMWQRRSFAQLPPELSVFRNPSSRPAAKDGVKALIKLLKKEVGEGTVQRFSPALPVGEWLTRFISLDDNPRAQRLIADGSPYSPATIELYKVYFNRYVSGDPYLGKDINTIDVPSTRAFMARVGMKKKKQTKKEKAASIEKVIAGTRTYEITISFVRMAFTEYWEDHRYWQNPFSVIDAPRRVKSRRRDTLQEDEIIKLFLPGVIPDILERAVAVAMFWAGLRRAEIFGLKTENLDWRTPQLKIDNAWKMFGSKKKRVLGDPKWHKRREAPFSEDLQAVIKLLQKEYGEREFVFSHKDGTLPHGKWINEKLPKWLNNAGIDLAGRKIVPHSARHSLASVLEANGVPLRYIRDMLGHSTLETTMGYLHTPEGTINKITKKINEHSKPEEQKVIQFSAEGKEAG